jgi:hypothetical protein
MLSNRITEKIAIFLLISTATTPTYRVFKKIVATLRQLENPLEFGKILKHVFLYFQGEPVL